MTDFDNLLKKYRDQFKKALVHLQYSFSKIESLSATIPKLSEEDLETWEGFVARFGRATDIYVNKYLRMYVLKEDPTFSGSVRDILNAAEKYRLIDSAHQWIEIRELRNKAAHDYEDEKLEQHFKTIKQLTPIVFDVEKKLK